MVMASHEGQGIKLFGTTITLHGRQVKEEHNQAEADNNPTLDKRPDKIIPCPRCKSMETKFCYFNNYNVNQPRHFCKGCQRYWTAGGALRNVPVGAGRRKAKPPGRDDLAGFTEGCLYDGSSTGVHQFELEGMVLDEWHIAAANGGGFRQVFPMKRRRVSYPDDGDSCGISVGQNQPTNEESMIQFHSSKSAISPYGCES